MWFGGWIVALQIANQVVSFVFVTALFALMYRMLPSVRVEWRDVWDGATETAMLFTVGQFAIGMYLGTAGVASGFGAAGAIVVLLVCVSIQPKSSSWVLNSLGCMRSVTGRGLRPRPIVTAGDDDTGEISGKHR